MKLSIKQIEEQLKQIKSEKDSFFQSLLNDERKGVQQLLKKWVNENEKKNLLDRQFYEMSTYESSLRAEGFQFIAGIDEVGRGPLAGPVVAAAVILPHDFYLPGLTDSKKLSEQKRESFFHDIEKQAVSIGIGVIDSTTIDNINIYEATKLAMKKAISNLHIQPDYLLIDAMKLNVDLPQQSIIKGDAKSISIAASSIIAKVTRDKYMVNLGEKYPQYGFSNNMGYGTKEHIEAIRNFGVLKEHRLSFAPVKDFVS